MSQRRNNNAAAAAAGAGGAWSPLDWDNKLGYWRVSDLTGKSDGDSLTALPDSYGLLADATGTAKYKSGVNGINGQPKALVGGANGLGFDLKVVNTLGDFMVWVVFDWTSTSFAQRLIDKSFSAGFWTGFANGIGGGIRETSSPFGLFLTAGSSPNYLIFGRSGTTRHVYHNATSSSSTVVSTLTSNRTTTLMYNGDNNGNGWTGGFAEAGMRSAWSDPSQLLNYITAKYGIPTS